MMGKVDFTFKVIMLGSASTGKTSLSERYINGSFNPDISLTVGVDFFVKTIDMNGKTIKLQIWDLGGERRFRFLLPTYCLGSSGALFLYDTTRKDTLNKIQDWINIVREKNGNIPTILCGNKIDLVEHREISKEDGEAAATTNKFDSFFEVSAKTGENINKVFEKLAETMFNSYINKKQK
jgi:uncharacterized protein